MLVKEGIGVLTGIVVLAGITFAIAHGGDTAAIMDSFGKSFSSVIKAATGN